MNFFKLIIGVLIEVFTFFLPVLLALLFRKTGPFRKTKSIKIKKVLNELNDKNDKDHLSQCNNEGSPPLETEKNEKKFKFPWWFKIVLYLISFVLMAVSIILVLFEGN